MLGVALAAMAVDHLLGTDREPGDEGLADPATFAISVGLCLATAVVVYGWAVPWALAGGDARAAIVAVALAAVSVVPGIAFVWLGSPFVLAGGGVDLRLRARNGARRRLAWTAVVVGSAFLAFGVVAYAVAAVAGLSEL